MPALPCCPKAPSRRRHQGYASLGTGVELLLFLPYLLTLASPPVLGAPSVLAAQGLSSEGAGAMGVGIPKANSLESHVEAGLGVAVTSVGTLTPDNIVGRALELQGQVQGRIRLGAGAGAGAGVEAGPRAVGEAQRETGSEKQGGSQSEISYDAPSESQSEEQSDVGSDREPQDLGLSPEVNGRGKGSSRSRPRGRGGRRGRGRGRGRGGRGRGRVDKLNRAKRTIQDATESAEQGTGREEGGEGAGNFTALLLSHTEATKGMGEDDVEGSLDQAHSDEALLEEGYTASQDSNRSGRSSTAGSFLQSLLRFLPFSFSSTARDQDEDTGVFPGSGDGAEGNPQAGLERGHGGGVFSPGGGTTISPSSFRPLCWETPKGASQQARGGVVVHGAGCQECQAGQVCTFNIIVARPLAAWVVGLQTAFKWDLMVVLEGPALAHADVAMVQQVGGKNAFSVFSATYQVWDPGMYRVTLFAPCMNLEYRGRSRRSMTVARWNMQVRAGNESSAGAGEGASAGGLAAGSIGGGKGGTIGSSAGTEGRAGGMWERPGEVDTTPCAYTMHGRWLLRPGGKYRWTRFPCAPVSPPAQAVPLLLARQRGIREINLVGDSNMRVLAQHLHHLFVAGYDNSEVGTAQYNLHPKHKAFSLRVPLSIARNHILKLAQGQSEAQPGDDGSGEAQGRTGGSGVDVGEGSGGVAKEAKGKGGSRSGAQEGLSWAEAAGTPEDAEGDFVINYQFAHFMFKAGRSVTSASRFQCRYMWTAVPVSRKAGLTVMNVGSWTGVHCRQPEQAVASHVMGALEWASTQGPPGARLVVRSVSTMFNPRRGTCHMRNSYAAFANVLGKSLSPRYGASFFDSWQIEAPRFQDTCGRGNHHYSCIKATPDGGRAMVGDVGEAVAKSLLHYLLYIMP